MLSKLCDFKAPNEGSAVALGFFDGVHEGHAQILEETVRQGKAMGLKPLAFTFSNHPSSVIRPFSQPPLINTFKERGELIEKHGLDCVFTEFTQEFSITSAKDFVLNYLLGRLNAKLVVVGSNYNFGMGAEGSVSLLKKMAKFGPEMGELASSKGSNSLFTVVELPSLMLDYIVISSSLVRSLIAEGEVRLASKLLGRAYSVTSTVIHGDARGRTLGIPTANLIIPLEKAAPPAGVYAVKAHVDGVTYPALAYYGRRPSFTSCLGQPKILEVHLLDPLLDNNQHPKKNGSFLLPLDALYGKQIKISFLNFFRSERKFLNAQQFCRQLQEDLDDVKRWFVEDNPSF